MPVDEDFIQYEEYLIQKHLYNKKRFNINFFKLFALIILGMCVYAMLFLDIDNFSFIIAFFFVKAIDSIFR